MLHQALCGAENANTTTWVCPTGTRRTTRSPWTPPTPPRSTAWRSSAPPSPPTPSAWRNTTCKKCGRAPTAPSAPCWTAPCSARPSWSRASSPTVSAPGRSPSPSPAMPTATCIRTPRCSVPGAGKAELVFTDADGTETRQHHLRLQDGPGVVQGMHNTGWLHRRLRPMPAFSYALDVKAGPVVLHQGYHLQDLRPPLQGHLPGDLRRGVQGAV